MNVDDILNELGHDPNVARHHLDGLMCKEIINVEQFKVDCAKKCHFDYFYNVLNDYEDDLKNFIEKYIDAHSRGEFIIRKKSGQFKYFVFSLKYKIKKERINYKFYSFYLTLI